jgi:hypothetical protein
LYTPQADELELALHDLRAAKVLLLGDPAKRKRQPKAKPKLQVRPQARISVKRYSKLTYPLHDAATIDDSKAPNDHAKSRPGKARGEAAEGDRQWGHARSLMVKVL